MNAPLVSITMPVFNGMPLIKASLESLKRQTYSNWECIIIDDGSTDGTSEFLNTITDSRFVVYHQENAGRAVARQKALELAKGKYIAMLDAEDLFHPNKIQTQVDILENRSDISLVTTAMCSFGTHTQSLYIRGTLCTSEIVFNGKNHPIHAPSLLRASRAKLCSYNPVLKLGEDQDFLEKYLSNGDKYISLSDVYYYYSELDSVSKQKIRKNYQLYIFKYFKESNYHMSLIFALKYLYAVVFFPLQSIDNILAKRGRKPSLGQIEDFKKYCLEFVSNI